MSTPVGQPTPPPAHSPLHRPLSAITISEKDRPLSSHTRESYEVGAADNFETRHLHVKDGHGRPIEHVDPLTQPGHARELEHRIRDDMELMKAERVASAEHVPLGDDLYKVHTLRRNSTHGKTPSILPPDELVSETTAVQEHGSPRGPWKPNAVPATRAAQFVKKLHNRSVLVRYFTYIVPVVLILLIPLMLGAFVFREKTVGGVYLMWFMVWLEVIWLCLWAGRIMAKMMPYPVAFIAGAFTNGSKKWRDMARMLEVPVTLFLWWLGIYCSFLPTMRNHHTEGNADETYYWEKTANIVLLSLFIATILNLIEKVIIQLIAINFHQRTYADRIELNKFQIGSLGKLYTYAKRRDKTGTRYEGYEGMDGPVVAQSPASGNYTPRVVLQGAGRTAQKAMNRVGDVVGKIAGDFTGKQVMYSTSPQQVVITLLQTTEGSNVLARRLYRMFRHAELDHVREEELQEAFDSPEESEAAFSMFDRDMNGDITCEEMEMACVEIGRERKAISASLKDLDSVISRFDTCLTIFVVIVVIVVFLSLISKSTAGVLTSASSTILALSWLFSGTAQEFLASLVFVFVKHPFDVGDRVDIYNTGTNRIDTFYVKEIALMYTEFKRPEGHVVQAPNSLLNTLFILNMRRSGPLAEAVPIVCKFGTTIDQIDDLRTRLVDYVKSEKREFQGKILTELTDIPDMHSVNLKVVFFYRSNLQNELLRLRRRNMFMCTLMCLCADLGIESPNMRWPGQKSSTPVYISGSAEEKLRQSLEPEHPGESPAVDSGAADESREEPTTWGSNDVTRCPSLRSARNPDFSLGTTGVSSDDAGDVFSDTYTRRGNLPSNFNRMNSVREDEESEYLESTKSHHSTRGRDSGSFFRRRALSNASNGSGNSRRTARGFFTSRHEEPGLPRSEVQAGPHSGAAHASTSGAWSKSTVPMEAATFPSRGSALPSRGSDSERISMSDLRSV